ncbi:MAG TPA: hypothetical protein VGW77_03520 [Candidatus Binatia bacterium]|jgi:hypothetical protein|nr:hypothetical protein [Candidatus Binatia bacterium]
MKKLLVMLILAGVLAGADVIAQEHKQEEHKEESQAPAKKATEPSKPDALKCCEGMDKMGDMKQGTPMKGDMKTKMEKMQEMKEKMAEKMKEKSVEDMNMKDTKGGAKPSEPSQDEHQH